MQASVLSQFLKIDETITRCTYTPGTSVLNESLFVDPEMMHGTPVEACPISVNGVEFLPRDVYRSAFGEDSTVRDLNTRNGEHSVAEGLTKVFDRTSFRGTVKIAFERNEKIFGLGQDEDGVWNKRGRIEYLYQHNMRIAIPFFVSDRGYGVLFNCSCLMVFDDSASPCKITLECADQIDFYVIRGTMDEIIGGYRKLTGQASLFPTWAMGYWQSKERYHTQAELEEVVQRFRREGIPLDVIVQDWQTWRPHMWGDKHPDPERFPDLKGAIDRIHEENVHCVFSIWPNTKRGKDFEELSEKKMFLTDGHTYDAFSPEARETYWNQIAEDLYPAGVDGWWCDSTEPFADVDWGYNFPVRRPERVRYDAVGQECETHLDAAVANAYALVHAKGIYEHHLRKPTVNLTRSGWAGIQKYGAVLWPGDTAASWAELRKEITKGLSINISGLPYWTVDAGAFYIRAWGEWFSNGEFEGKIDDPGYQELFTRWMQFAGFLPVFRSHGTDSPREYWNFKEPFRSAVIESIRLRYFLMPYIKEQFRKIREEHFTLMRSLLFDFPEDPRSAEIDDEYLFGSDLLVCPITRPYFRQAEGIPVADEDKTKECYLPSGADWYDFYTGEYYSGGQTRSVSVTLDHIPLFVRAGTELPVAEGMTFAEDPKETKLLSFPKR